MFNQPTITALELEDRSATEDLDTMMGILVEEIDVTRQMLEAESRMLLQLKAMLSDLKTIFSDALNGSSREGTQGKILLDEVEAFRASYCIGVRAGVASQYLASQCYVGMLCANLPNQ
jgi:hypothetical protein